LVKKKYLKRNITEKDLKAKEVEREIRKLAYLSRILRMDVQICPWVVIMRL